eukprot:4983674-Prymnesium_polylepis.1
MRNGSGEVHFKTILGPDFICSFTPVSIHHAYTPLSSLMPPKKQSSSTTAPRGARCAAFSHQLVTTTSSAFESIIWRTIGHRPHRRTGPPSTPRTTRRHSHQRRDTGADGSARYVGGAGRLPIRPLNDTYTVPEAPQSRVAL